nr:hypothetical protein GCM10020092_059980 [Actinoplanes digitatis]
MPLDEAEQVRGDGPPGVDARGLPEPGHPPPHAEIVRDRLRLAGGLLGGVGAHLDEHVTVAAPRVQHVAGERRHGRQLPRPKRGEPGPVEERGAERHGGLHAGGGRFGALREAAQGARDTLAPGARQVQGGQHRVRPGRGTEQLGPGTARPGCRAATGQADRAGDHRTAGECVLPTRHVTTPRGSPTNVSEEGSGGGRRTA